ncbi:hypothetical protein Tco_1097835 [Tanacetum coccineum]
MTRLRMIQLMMMLVKRLYKNQHVSMIKPWRMFYKMLDQEKEATKQSDAVRKEFEAQCDCQLLQEKITRASMLWLMGPKTFSLVGPSSGPSFVPFGGSFPIDVANLPHDPLMPELEDTAEI